MGKKEESIKLETMGHLKGIDLMKYIMAFAVVAIHVSTGSCCGQPFPPLCRWFNSLAVPFFFIVSGFLLARGLDNFANREQRVNFALHRSLQLFRLFGLWLLIYAPLSLSIYIMDQTPLTKIISTLAIGIFSRGEMICAFPLWFLYSLALITVGVAATEKDSRLWPFLLLTVCLFYIGYVLTQKFDVTELPRKWMLTINLLPMRAVGGGIYILSGFAIYHWRLLRKSKTIVLGLIAISILMFFLNIPLNELFGGMGIFFAAYLIPANKSDRIYLGLRTQSMWIYYLHMYVIFAVVLFCHHYGLKLELWPVYGVVVASTAIISFGLSRLQRKQGFGFLNSLTK